jgi:hypothetical protein
MLWFKLDDASGPLVDYGSRGVNATVVGAPSFQFNAGPDGNSYINFGANDFNYANVPDAADLGITAATGKTFFAAYYNTSWAGNRTIISKMQTGADRDYAMFVVAAGASKQSFRIYQDAGTSAYSAVEVTTTKSLDAWHFMAVRVNTDGTIDMWHDSTTEAHALLTAPTGTAEQNGTADVWIGNMPFTGYNAYALAHVAIVEGAMNTVDVQTIMQAAIDEGWTA